MNMKQQYSTKHIPLYMTPNYDSNSTIPHYRRNSTQYIPRYYCLFFLPASRSTFFARDPHFPPGMPFKLLGYIYTIPTIYIFLCGIYIIRTSTAICSDDIYIYFNAVISTLERHGTAICCAARASQGQRPSAIFSFFFLCVLFPLHGRL